MSGRITITAGDITAEAELNESPSARAVYDALPLTARARTWGEEIYFDTGLTLKQAEDARQDMGVGEVAYWPTGKALCVFFGPTPASGPDGAPKAAGPVNPVGRITGNATRFREVPEGAEVRVEKA